MAYFEEIRIHGEASQARTAALMGKSLRTVGHLERQYRAGFLTGEAELEQVREVEGALDESPSTLQEVRERVSHIDGERIELILERLVGVGRARLDGGGQRRYTLNPAFISLVGDDVDAQLDGLRHQLDVIISAVRARFLQAGRPAVARTLSFVADSAEVEAMADGFVMDLRRGCIEAEEAALKRRIRERYAVTFVLTPIPPPDRDEL